ncbi:MAG: hypothetical protein ACLFTV_13330, partial [Desulfococcaceae bacterium]
MAGTNLGADWAAGGPAGFGFSKKPANYPLTAERESRMKAGHFQAPVAQLDRVPDYESVGRR